MRQLVKKNWMGRLIRRAIDACPDGICVAESDGRPILSNRAINALSLQLSGYTMLNAADWWEQVKARAMPGEGGMTEDGTEEYLLLRLENGSVWQCRRRLLSVQKSTLWQYEAADVTQLNRYREYLRENNLRTEALHERQRELIRNIDRNNQEKEVLHAKMQIHDSMGRLILMTKRTLAGGETQAGRDGEALLLAWRNLIEDMSNAAMFRQSRSTQPEPELIKAAAMIGCRVSFLGRQPAERKALLLLYAAIREALTNAVRHAGANELFVEIREQENVYGVRIHDNGSHPVRRPLEEGTGLGTLRRRLESEGASLHIETDGGVVLVLEIPKE